MKNCPRCNETHDNFDSACICGYIFTDVKKCNKCGKYYWSNHAKCLFCGALERSNNSNTSEQTNEDKIKKETNSKRPKKIEIHCSNCGGIFSALIPNDLQELTCQACNSHYLFSYSSGIFKIRKLVDEPDLGDKYQEEFRLLGISSKNANISSIKQAWKKQIELYHPDRVDHLGSELKELANLKTQQINKAYEVLKKAYGN